MYYSRRTQARWSWETEEDFLVVVADEHQIRKGLGGPEWLGFGIESSRPPHQQLLAISLGAGHAGRLPSRNANQLTTFVRIFSPRRNDRYLGPRSRTAGLDGYIALILECRF